MLTARSNNPLAPLRSCIQYINVRTLTKRPKYEDTKLRVEKQQGRALALGKRVWPAVTVSGDNTIYKIQQKVFGYERGGEEYLNPEKEIGGENKPLKTGRKLARKMFHIPDLSSWYGPQLIEKHRFVEMRMMKRNPRNWVNEYLGPHRVQEYGQEDFGPFWFDTPGYERAIMRAKAELVATVNVKETQLGPIQKEIKRAEDIIRKRKKGKAAPKKGQGKQAVAKGKS